MSTLTRPSLFGPATLAASGLALLAIVTYWPTIKKKLVRIRNRAIGNYVGKSVKKLFMQEGGLMQLGEMSRPDGTKLKFFKNAVKTLGEWYAVSKKHADVEYLVYKPGRGGGEEVRWTYGETMSRAEELRYNLIHQLGVRKQDRVSILMSNIPEFPVAFMAVTQMGAIAVTLNAFWEGEEIEYGLLDSGSNVLIADEKRLARLVPNGRLDKLRAQGLKIIVVRPTTAMLADGILSFEQLSHSKKLPPTFEFDSTVDPNSIAYIMYTSGTTSPRPKGVVQTHTSTVQTCMSFQLFVELMKVLRGGPKIRRCDLICAPLFHASALCAVFLLSFFDGHKLVMIPKWDADYALQVCLDEKVTFFGAMPTMLSDVLANDLFWKNRDKFVFTNIGTGGAATPSKLIHRTAAALPKVSQGSGWGLTESNSIGTIIGGPDYLEFPESCGKPHPIVDIKLVDPESGEDVIGVNVPGELCIRSPTNMQGYWNNPEATKQIMLKGNWIRSGDLGTIDEEGFVRIIDRVKDIVIRGGENISTSEVEEVLYAFSTAGASKDEQGLIFEACTFGLPHERLGEQLAAAIVPFPGKSVNVDALRAFCEQRLAKFKVPSMFFVRDLPLPRGATGKILKRKLKDEYKAFVTS